MNIPVGINNRSIGCSVTGFVRFALRSMPAEPSVAYSGKGLEDWLMIRTLTFDIPQI
jgi:hypothetical protein